MFGAGQDTVAAQCGRSSWTDLAVRPSGGGYAAFRVLLAAILLVAALLKGYQLATGPVLGDGLLASRPILIALVEFEWLFGVWMLSSLYPKRTWQVALACFGAFACVSFYKGLAGDASCGCFGRVEVSPWWTLCLDVAAVVALLSWPPRRESADAPGRRDLAAFPGSRAVAGSLAVALFLGVPGVWAMASYRPASLAADGTIVGRGNSVVLHPEKWVGKRFPLIEHINIGRRLLRGEWLVVLYHHDCPKCRELLRYYVDSGRSWAGGVMRQRLALVEVPPYGDGQPASLSPDTVMGRLADQREWFVATPVEVMLAHGRVVHVGFASDAATKMAK